MRLQLLEPVYIVDTNSVQCVAVLEKLQNTALSWLGSFLEFTISWVFS
jgi:hypothetical protein